MKPVSPVIPHTDDLEIVYARRQQQYQPLPVIRTERLMMSRWQLTDEERQHIANGGDLFICCIHFGNGLQPIMPIAASPDRALEIMMETDREIGGGGAT
jgi:hypothetical protein